MLPFVLADFGSGSWVGSLSLLRRPLRISCLCVLLAPSGQAWQRSWWGPTPRPVGERAPCAQVRAPALRPGTRRPARGPGRGAAQGAVNRLDTNAAGEGQGGRGSRRGRGCGAGVWRNVQTS